MNNEHHPLDDRHRLTRRQLMRLGLILPVPYLLAGCGDSDPESGAPASTSHTTAGSAGGTESAAGTAPPAGSATTLPLTPTCDDGDGPTPSQTEGPYFTPGSPERTSLLEPGGGGTRLVLTGTVVSPQCRPVARALVDFWQADDRGAYDNTGFRFRGHQFTDDQGRYRLETVVPGLYSGRTRHLHVKVQAPGRSVLTTQLYFPGETRNTSDGIFAAPLLLRNVRDVGGVRQADFLFVVDAG